MFEKNDYVYYASGGVCRIFDIRYAPLEGMPSDRLYYVMSSLHDPSGVIYVPVNSETVFLRRLLTREEADELIARIPSLNRFEEPNAKLLRGKYADAMRTHDPAEWIRVIKTVYHRTKALAATSHSQRLSDTERSFADDARRYLHAELSIALGIPTTEIEAYIREHIGATE